MKFIVQMAETRNFEIPVEADNQDEAREKARALWREAATVGQWEIADTSEEIVAITEPRLDRL